MKLTASLRKVSNLEVDENVGSLDNLKKLLIQKYYIEPEVRK